MASPTYYNDAPDDSTTALRKKQAVQSALVGDQNMVDPTVPYSAPGTVRAPGADYGSGATVRAGGTGPDSTIDVTRGPSGVNDMAPDGVLPPVTPAGDVQNPPNPPPTPGTNPNLPPQIPKTPAEWLATIGQFKSLYQPGQLPGAYSPMQLMTPEAQTAQSLQFGLLDKVLANPDAYTAENVQQMQEAQKEQALAAEHDSYQKMLDRYAAMGRAGSGQIDAGQRRLFDQTTGQILQSGRDIALQSANANWQSRLGALNSSNDLIASSVGNQQAQAGENYKGQQSALTRALAQEGLNKDQASLALQGALSTSGLSLDQYKAILAALTQLGIFNASASNANMNNSLPTS